MLDQALYAVVALIYFYKVATSCQKNELVLDNRASVNVACVFVIAQPLCLLLGGYTGLVAYCIFAIFSYNFLPRNAEATRAHKSLKKKKVK